MKKICFLSLLFGSLLISLTAFGQCDQDITLSSQEDVDNFMVDYNCTEIGGDLTIDGGDIVDLSSLSAIISIMGNLVIINNAALTNIDGLNSISSINGNLTIINNDALINIDGLSNLNSIENSISIFNNPVLTNINGLNNITSIGNNIAILYNSALTNINGLNSLSSIGGFLQIQYNDALNNCCIVASINAENITIEDNTQGCNSLQEITDSCSMTSLQTIKENPSIQVYPNPNTGTFTIESKDLINTLKIYNSIGQLIQEDEVNAPTTKVNIPTIQTAIYFVAIETEMGTIVEKVLIQ